MDNKTLIELASRVIRPHQTQQGSLIGDVGAAILSNGGSLFTGVCVDTPSWGLCAERAAAAAMVTSGEYIAAKIVAVWKKSETGEFFVLPPCGHCREFLRNLDNGNLNTKVILGYEKSSTLAELLPQHEWPKPLPK